MNLLNTGVKYMDCGYKSINKVIYIPNEKGTNVANKLYQEQTSTFSPNPLDVKLLVDTFKATYGGFPDSIGYIELYKQREADYKLKMKSNHDKKHYITTTFGNFNHAIKTLGENLKLMENYLNSYSEKEAIKASPDFQKVLSNFYFNSLFKYRFNYHVNSYIMFLALSDCQVEFNLSPLELKPLIVSEIARLESRLKANEKYQQFLGKY